MGVCRHKMEAARTSSPGVCKGHAQVACARVVRKAPGVDLERMGQSERARPNRAKGGDAMAKLVHSWVAAGAEGEE